MNIKSKFLLMSMITIPIRNEEWQQHSSTKIHIQKPNSKHHANYMITTSPKAHNLSIKISPKFTFSYLFICINYWRLVVLSVCIYIYNCCGIALFLYQTKSLLAPFCVVINRFPLTFYLFDHPHEDETKYSIIFPFFLYWMLESHYVSNNVQTQKHRNITAL